MILLPNSGSFVVRRWAGAIVTYGNQIGLHMAWSFFSPNPWNMTYVKYQVQFRDQGAKELRDAITHFVPPGKIEAISTASQRRQFLTNRILALDPDRLENILIRWICKSHSGSTHVDFARYSLQQPTLDQALESSAGSFRGLFVEQKDFERLFSCNAKT